MFSFLLAGCIPSAGTVPGEQKYTFYQIPELSGMSFRHPLGALILDDSLPKAISFDGCKVFFGKEYLKDESGFEVKERGADKFNFRAFYKNDEIVYYLALLKGEDFGFWLEENVEVCLDFMDSITDFFTDKPLYYNERFRFQVQLLTDFKVENLADGEGVLLKKIHEEPNFAVEIGAFGTENVLGFTDLADFLEKKYPGYSKEFLNNGVFVDESLSTTEAIRHYFVVSNDTIYEAYMKIPSVRYDLYKDVFVDFAGTLAVAD